MKLLHHCSVPSQWAVFFALLLLAHQPAEVLCVEESSSLQRPPTTTTIVSRRHQKNELEVPVRPPMVLEALEQNKPLYYFGLGSNMSRKKLENRGLNGTKIDVLTMEAAIVPNYRLAFNMRGFPPIEPGMGSLEPVDSKSTPLLAYSEGECHGALVKLDPENYEMVMRSEGVGNGQKDQGYEEIVVDAYPYSKNQQHQQLQKPVKAIALRARPHVRLDFDPCPSQRYMNILKEGARELGLKACYQEFLERHPVQQLSKWQKKLGMYNLLFTFSLSTRLNGWRGWSQFQSRLLFGVYSTPNDAALIQLASTMLSACILLPGSMLGFCLFHGLKWTGKEPPPFWARMVTMIEDAGEKEATAKTEAADTTN
jgi:hypothetical protein